MKKKIILGLLLGISSLVYSQQQVVDLSTGILNNTTSLLPLNTDDDTWQVKMPASNVFVPVKCVSSGPWVSAAPNAGWLSPVALTNGGPSNHCPGGDYIYRMTFDAASCGVLSAVIKLTYAGDNQVVDIKVNNNPSHSLSNASFSVLTNITINILPTEIIPNATNTVIIKVHNFPDTYSGLTVFGNLTINYQAIPDPNLIPSITGNTIFCPGDFLTFAGSDGAGTATSYYWEIAECDASGVPITGGYLWHHAYLGSPGSFTFPSSSTLPCNTYYKIKLAIRNECTDWVETNLVVFINCNPIANAGPDVTICTRDCATIGVPLSAGHGTQYEWHTNIGTSSIIVGNADQISVCPTTTTTYTLNVTNSVGCVASDEVTVYVEDNDPSFSLSSNLNPADNFYTLFASPTVNPQPVGSGFAWFIDEIVSPSNTTVIAGSSAANPGCWWTTLTCNFNGYDGPLFTNTGNNPMLNGCSSPSVGQFTSGHTYRIIRGTWSDVCPWEQYAVIVYMTHSFSGGNNIHYMEDMDAPDYSHFVTSHSSIENNPVNDNDLLSVYPNPNHGQYTIEVKSNKSFSTEMSIMDISGKKVYSQMVLIEKNINRFQMNQDQLPAGIYFIKINGLEEIIKMVIKETY